MATIAVLVGCGGSQPPPKVAQAVGEVADLVFLLSTEGGGMTRTAAADAVESTLVNAGFRVRVEPGASHDATASLRVTETEEPSFIQIRVNGELLRTYRVDLTLVVAAEGYVIEKTTARFKTSDGTVPPSSIARLVARLGASTRLAKFANQRAAVARQRAAAAAAQHKAERIAAEKRAAAELAEWNSTVGECREPNSAHACDALRSWHATAASRQGSDDERESRDEHGSPLPSHEGARDAAKVEEAAQILKAAEPAIAVFAEADAWANTDTARCKAATSYDDCTKLSEYLGRYPNGQHADEARHIWDVGTKSLAAAEKREQQRALAEEHAAARQGQQAGCRAKCASESCVMFTTKEKHAQCVAQCQQGCS